MYAMKRISSLKFIVKIISKSPSQCLPQIISSADSAKNPLLGLEEKKKNHHHHHHEAVLENEKKKEGCRLHPQVKYSTWDEILRKTKRIDVDDMPTKSPSHSAVLKGSSPSVFKTASSPAFNLKGKPPLVMSLSDNHHAKTDGAMIPSTSKPKKTVSMKSSTAKADVPVLVRCKSKHHDSDSRPMQFKANKAFNFPSKRPRNQDENDQEISALKLKRRKTNLSSSGVKPKPAESIETSPASSCQTVVSSCRVSKKAVDSMNVSSDASSVFNIPPADKQPNAVFKNATAHSNTIGETNPQDDDCGISHIIDEDTYNKAKHRAEILRKHEATVLRHITDPLQKEATRQQMRRKVIIIEGKMRAYEKSMAARISMEKVVIYNEERRAARIALEKVVKTVEFNDTNTECMKELERLINVRGFDLNFAPSAVPKPLEWIGLHLKEVY